MPFNVHEDPTMPGRHLVEEDGSTIAYVQHPDDPEHAKAAAEELADALNDTMSVLEGSLNAAAPSSVVAVPEGAPTVLSVPPITNTNTFGGE